MTGYFENTMGSLGELARVRLNAEGKFQVFVGTQSNGQGHETTFPQIVAIRFDFSPEDVRVIQEDTQSVTRGHGTVGSRALILRRGCVVE